jgi:hypothetical protein
VKSIGSDLHTALVDLQKHAGSYVDISRLQLALRGLEQGAGKETIRIAVMGTSAGSRSNAVAKELMRVLLADPLAVEEYWEQVLRHESQSDQAILIRLDDSARGGEVNRSNSLVKELAISSPTMRGHRVEILLLTADLSSRDSDPESTAIMVPAIEIPMSTTGRHTPVTTPVHKAIIIGSGLTDISAVQDIPSHHDSTILTSALNLHNYPLDPSLPFQVIDISLAASALASFRESVENAMRYERDWFQSGVPSVLEWLKSGTLDTDGTMKAPVRNLIGSVLRQTEVRLQNEEQARSQAMQAYIVPPSTLMALRGGLQTWAERAHTELRDQLDIAFAGHRWRKLGWWKLFWRVDDVSMIATDILTQRYLTEAEKEVIYLSGRIEQAGVLSQTPKSTSKDWAYKEVPRQLADVKIGAEPPALRLSDLVKKEDTEVGTTIQLQPWPLQIPVSRFYLLLNSVPALQALAQKLVLQTLTTSGFSSAFAGLIYVSTLSTSMYEAGAVAALGIVWSLRHMQKKWETARAFWEGEVREEGRKSVRTVEAVVDNVLVTPAEIEVEGAEELRVAQEAVDRAKNALDATK